MTDKIRIKLYFGGTKIIKKEEYDDYIGKMDWWENIDEKLIGECKEIIKATENDYNPCHKEEHVSWWQGTE